jgi:hypothetical protein
MALVSTHPLTEMSTKDLSGGGKVKGRPAHKADSFTAFLEQTVKCENLDVSQPRMLAYLLSEI